MSDELDRGDSEAAAADLEDAESGDEVDAESGDEVVDPEQGEAELSESEPAEAENVLTDPEPPRAIPPLREVAEIRKPSTLGGIFYLGVLAAALAGIGIAATGAWRTGASWLAASLIVAAAARVVLPDDNAGMLRVRHKALDGLILAGAGVAIIFLVWSIPDRPR